MTPVVESRTLLMINGTIDNLLPAAFRVERYDLPGAPVYVIHVDIDGVTEREMPLRTVSTLEDVAEKLVDEYAAFLCCDYCQEQAGWRVTDTTDERLCTDCVMDHRPVGVRDYARKLTRNQRVAVLLADLISRND